MKKRLNYFITLSGLLLAVCGCSTTPGESTGKETTSGITTSKPTSEVTTVTPTTTVTPDTSKPEPFSTSLPTSSTSSDHKATLDDFTTTEKLESFRERGYQPLFTDMNFKNGFRITKTATDAEGGPYHSEYYHYYEETKTKTPSWTFCQWGSKYDIYQNFDLASSSDGFEYTLSSKGGKTIDGNFVPAKKATFNTKTGSTYLECNTEVEYDTPRQNGQPWTHVLLEQDFSDNLIHVTELESLVMEAQFEVQKFEDKMGNAFNPNLHAAQVVWYITIQNRNQQSADYGKYIWFGVGLWDNRNAGKTTSLYAQLDGGTSSFIYNPSSMYYYADNGGKVPTAHQKMTASMEVMKVVKSAYNLAIQRGFLGTTQFDDLYVGGMNFGFEVPGTYNIGVQFDDIGVYYKYK